MIIRSRAPLRLGLAGGGTDVSPYCDNYGGAVLNATINMYSYCTLEPLENGKIVFEATDRNENFECDINSEIVFDGVLDLHKGVYKRIVKDFCSGKQFGVRVSTYSEAPAGSGLGTSSTMVVCILKAFIEWLRLPLGEYEIAKLAYDIERKDIALAGGKQDQYAATFGGFNFMEFYDKDRVIVNPLRVKRWIINELECSLILYFTGVSRSSAAIISDQIKKAETNDKASISAMGSLKEQAYIMKDAVLTGNIAELCEALRNSWEAKKNVSNSISNKHIEECYDYIMQNGGLAAKVSGAGGGGFMMIICDPQKRKELLNALEKRDGKAYTINFDLDGTKGWIIR